MKEYTIDDFKPVLYGEKPIVADGYLYAESPDANINTSSILTKLIQLAGRYCEHFASDLFLDWQAVQKVLSDPRRYVDLDEDGWGQKSWLLGFRESGVDHTDFVLSRYHNDGPIARYEYRKLYKLTLTLDTQCSPAGTSCPVELRLLECQR